MGSQAVIVSAVRTPIGSFNGILRSVSATALGSLVVAEALRRAKVPGERVNEVLLGCVLQSGLGQAPARQAPLGAGLPNSVGATTINKVCGSGLKSIILGAQMIALDEAGVIVAGGMESMTNAPYMLPDARDGYRLGHRELIDSVVKDGLWDVYGNMHMGDCGEICAEKYGFIRSELDDFAMESYRRANRLYPKACSSEKLCP